MVCLRTHQKTKPRCPFWVSLVEHGSRSICPKGQGPSLPHPEPHGQAAATRADKLEQNITLRIVNLAGAPQGKKGEGLGHPAQSKHGRFSKTLSEVSAIESTLSPPSDGPGLLKLVAVSIRKPGLWEDLVNTPLGFWFGVDLSAIKLETRQLEGVCFLERTSYLAWLPLEEIYDDAGKWVGPASSFNGILGVSHLFSAESADACACMAKHWLDSLCACDAFVAFSTMETSTCGLLPERAEHGQLRSYAQIELLSRNACFSMLAPPKPQLCVVCGIPGQTIGMLHAISSTSSAHLSLRQECLTWATCALARQA